MKLDDLPQALKPYQVHGIDISSINSSKQAITECPWCQKIKFYIGSDTGMYHCKVCDEKGNIYTFFKKIITTGISDEYWKEEDFEDLKKDRGFLQVSTLRSWGVCKNFLTGEFVVPGFNAEGKIIQLYRYIKLKDKPKRVLMATVGLNQGLFMSNSSPLLDGRTSKAIKNIIQTEGPWDGMALWETLKQMKLNLNDVNSGWTRVASINSSCLADTEVIAVPGANVRNQKWDIFYGNRDTILIYHNDHERIQHGKKLAAGRDGCKAYVEMLSKAESIPSRIRWLEWGKDNGINNQLHSGYDVRDLLKSLPSMRERGDKVQEMLRDLIKPIPAEWIPGRDKKAVKEGKPQLNLIHCEDWRTLQTSWRKSMKWTPGLDHALSCMLASVLSTLAVGDQLWIKVVGPPSCLDAMTPIYDPIDGTTKTVEQRYREGNKFFVYTLKQDGKLGIAQALPPEQYQPTDLYELKTKLGKKITVTAGHRIWNGAEFVTVSSLIERLQESLPCLLESTLDIDLLTQKQGVQHCSQTTEDSQADYRAYPCSYGEQLPLGEVYDQDEAPSLTDVQELSSRRTKQSHNLQEQRNGIGIEGVDLRVSELEDVEQSLDLSDVSELLNHLFESVWHTQKSQLQTNTEQPVPVSSLESSSSLISLQRKQEFYKHELDQLEVCKRSELESNPYGTDERKDQSSTYSNLSYKRSESEYCSSEGTSGLLENQLSSSQRSQQVYDQIDKDQSPVVDVLLSKEQPRYTSISQVSRTVDRRILTVTDEVVKVTLIKKDVYYDFHVPETNNYWAVGMFHHNCGKSTLCEALSTNTKRVKANSTMRGFHSGFQTDKEGSEDNSLLNKLNGMTLITKDGDTLLQSPNLGQILSEARDIYDRVSRTQYRNKMSKDYLGVSLTWILCGTSSLRSLDNSELGERFLDVVIAERIDPDLEDEILIRSVRKSFSNMKLSIDANPESQQSPELTSSYQLSGGYVEYLRSNAQAILSSVEATEEQLKQCILLGKFVAYLRARPSSRQIETAQREFATRLVSQITRMATCLAGVLNKTEFDEEVMSRVTKVAYDTARGISLQIVTHLAERQEAGLPGNMIAMLLSQPTTEVTKLLRFMRQIEILEVFNPEINGAKTRAIHYRLTDRFYKLFQTVSEFPRVF